MIKNITFPAGEMELSALNPPSENQKVKTYIDYTGTEVVASVKQVPGTDWYLAAKKETPEILYRFNSEIAMLWLIMGLIYLALASIGYLIVKSTKARYLREKYREDLNRQAIMKHFDFVMKHGNDIILLIDSDFNIVEANERAVETYGYSRDKLIGTNISEIQAPSGRSRACQTYPGA